MNPTGTPSLAYGCMFPPVQFYLRYFVYIDQSSKEKKIPKFVNIAQKCEEKALSYPIYKRFLILCSNEYFIEPKLPFQTPV